jgi:hypothetical protein
VRAGACAANGLPVWDGTSWGAADRADLDCCVADGSAAPRAQIYNLETEYLAAEYSQFGTVLKARVFLTQCLTTLALPRL